MRRPTNGVLRLTLIAMANGANTQVADGKVAITAAGAVVAAQAADAAGIVDRGGAHAGKQFPKLEELPKGELNVLPFLVFTEAECLSCSIASLRLMKV